MHLSVYVTCVFVGVMTDDAQTCILTVVVVIIIIIMAVARRLVTVHLLTINSMTHVLTSIISIT